MVDVDIFVGNPTKIDWDVYQLWLRGFADAEAATVQQNKGVLNSYDATFADLRSEILDYYRLFCHLEYYLKNPQRMIEQQIFVMDLETKNQAIEFYYQFDSEVVREFLGKKLTTRNRKYLDEVSDKVHVPIRSCRRQFDNLKKVYKAVDDIPGSLQSNIKSVVCISVNLAKRYASLVFMANNRFELSKKKLSYITLADFMHCANEMIQNWTSTSTDAIGLEFDHEFLLHLRDIRILAERDLIDKHKTATLKDLKSQVCDKSWQDTESIFKTLSKNIVTIASSLNHSKEVRDFFLDIVEKIIDPLQSLHWTKSDVALFFRVYKSSSRDLLQQSYLLEVWHRYLETVTSCVLQMYHT